MNKNTTLDTLGLWNMGDPMFHTLLSPVEGKRIIRHFFRHGVTIFDTAYSYGNADTLLASAMKELQIERTSYSIWTKVMPLPTLRKKTEASLRRLNTDYVDILMLHWPSDEGSVYTSLKTLEALMAEGKTREIGVSNFPLPLLEKVKGDFPVLYHERPLSPVWTTDYRKEQELGIKTIAYGPSGFGMIGQNTLPEDRRKDLHFLKTEAYSELQGVIHALSEKYGTSSYAVSYAFVRSLSPFAIVRGASQTEQFQIPFLDLEEDELKTLEDLSSQISATYPRDNIFSHNYLCL
ncbi:MAG: aldo/keto reductase [Spirochaetales bacterium]|nr:aldo/keto reductase [Candidatus Physcosoma equi]